MFPDLRTRKMVMKNWRTTGDRTTKLMAVACIFLFTFEGLFT